VSENQVPDAEDLNPKTQNETEGTKTEIKTGLKSGPDVVIES